MITVKSVIVNLIHASNSNFICGFCENKKKLFYPDSKNPLNVPLNEWKRGAQCDLWGVG